jgi:hypothetical protein
MDAGTSCPFDASPPATDAAPRYSGSVVASWSVSSGGVISAGFPNFTGPPQMTGTGTVCGCGGGIALPSPSSSAGIITVRAGPCEADVASLSFDDESGFPEYPQASASWTPGAALAVTAQGDPAQVHAFAGMLQTGEPLAGLTPAFGPQAQDIVIPLDQSLVVSWTPEGRSGEVVAVELREVTTSSVVTCSCYVSDSAGTLTMPAASLSHFVPTATPHATATAQVVRTIDGALGIDDAVVDLVGVVSAGGPVVLQ